MNATHTFTNPEMYNVTLTVANEASNSTVTKQNLITVAPPQTPVTDFATPNSTIVYGFWPNWPYIESYQPDWNTLTHASEFSKTKNRIIVVPHCVRALDCPASSTILGIQCRDCGKCIVTQLRKDAKKYGYDLYIFTGSSALVNILKYKPADGLLGIAWTQDSPGRY